MGTARARALPGRTLQCERLADRVWMRVPPPALASSRVPYTYSTSISIVLRHRRSPPPHIGGVWPVEVGIVTVPVHSRVPPSAILPTVCTGEVLWSICVH